MENFQYLFIYCYSYYSLAINQSISYKLLKSSKHHAFIITERLYENKFVSVSIINNKFLKVVVHLTINSLIDGLTRILKGTHIQFDELL